jgi:hypothetical protein
MMFTLPFLLKGVYSIPKNYLRKNRAGKRIVSLPDDDRPFFLETVFEESDQIGDEVDEIFDELEYFFSQTLEDDIRTVLPGVSLDFRTDLKMTHQTPSLAETGNATISFELKGDVILTLHSKTQIDQSTYTEITELLEATVSHGNRILNDFTLRELSDLPNWNKLYIQLTYEDPLKEATNANSIARQQVRAITGFEGLPENITRKIGRYLTGPLNNSRLRSRPLPKALTKEVLEMTPYERQQRGGRTRKQTKTGKRSRKISRRRHSPRHT